MPIGMDWNESEWVCKSTTHTRALCFDVLCLKKYIEYARQYDNDTRHNDELIFTI